MPGFPHDDPSPPRRGARKPSAADTRSDFAPKAAVPMAAGGESTPPGVSPSADSTASKHVASGTASTGATVPRAIASAVTNSLTPCMNRGSASIIAPVRVLSCSSRPRRASGLRQGPMRARRRIGARPERTSGGMPSKAFVCIARAKHGPGTRPAASMTGEGSRSLRFENWLNSDEGTRSDTAAC